jgi:hypothetical protein
MRENRYYASPPNNEGRAWRALAEWIRWHRARRAGVGQLEEAGPRSPPALPLICDTVIRRDGGLAFVPVRREATRRLFPRAAQLCHDLLQPLRRDLRRIERFADCQRQAAHHALAQRPWPARIDSARKHAAP